MRRILASATVGTVALSFAFAAAAAQDPKARTAALAKALMDVKAPPEDGDGTLSPADKTANKKTFAALDTFFDFDALTTTAMAPHRKKLNAAQMKQYQATFKELIRLVAYPDSGSFLRTAKRKLAPAKVKGKEATVGLYVEVTEDDLEIDVVFYWKKTKDWKVTDVAFDGARLTKDYQNQFGRIISKDGVAGLLTKLDARLKKEQEAKSK